MKKIRDYLLNKNYKNGKYKTFFAVIVCISVILLSIFLGNFMAIKGVFLVNSSDNIKSVATQLNDVDKYSSLFLVRDTLIKVYDGEIDDDKLLEGAMKGMTNSLKDPYTVFKNKEELENFMNESNTSISRIGISIVPVEGKIVIFEPKPDSPAENAGLKENDIIEKINGIEYTSDDIAKAINTISQSDGKKVTLSIKRSENQIFDVEVVPENVDVNVISGDMLEDSIGYIRIESFMNKDTTKDFVDKINQLKDDGMKGLILDLRENPGGLLSEAVGVASQFVPDGNLITYTVNKYGEKNESKSTGGNAGELPLVILINENSASASEVVTGALRDYNVATLVGNNTFGKGIVQETFKFKNDIGGLKVTTAKYYTPNGENIHKIGIKPDVEVEASVRIGESEYSRDKDDQLKTAIEEMKKKLQ